MELLTDIAFDDVVMAVGGLGVFGLGAALGIFLVDALKPATPPLGRIGAAAWRVLVGSSREGR